jgi:RNA polymerase sigma factor (sigma-70 family)
VSPFVSARFLQAQPDARLLKLASEGHERAFEALVRRHRRSLLAYSRRLLTSGSRSEDAVQQALLQAWLALQGGVEVRDAKPWFFRIVHNVALNMQRGAAGQDHAQLTDEVHGNVIEPEPDGWIAVKDVFAELAQLPPLQRQALLRTSLEGQSHDEVAVALGVSVGAVRGLVYRARSAVRAALAALIPPPFMNWALTPTKPGVPTPDRLAELVAGGGGLGVVAMNGSVAVVSVGALVAGAAVVPHSQSTAGRPPHAPAATAAASNVSAGTHVYSASVLRVHGGSPSAYRFAVLAGVAQTVHGGGGLVGASNVPGPGGEGASNKHRTDGRPEHRGDGSVSSGGSVPGPTDGAGSSSGSIPSDVTSSSGELPSGSDPPGDSHGGIPSGDRHGPSRGGHDGGGDHPPAVGSTPSAGPLPATPTDKTAPGD